jgi:hypothetical protein
MGTNVSLSSVLWDNWQLWSSGGLAAESLEDLLTDGDVELLLDWLDEGFRKEGLVRPLIDEKKVVDIATWCIHGTHSLLLLPLDIRLRRIEVESRHFGIPAEVTVRLIQSNTTLPDAGPET